MAASENNITRHDLKAKRFFVSVTCNDDANDEYAIECANATDDTDTLKHLLRTFKKKRSAESIRVFDSKHGLAWVCFLDDISWDDFYTQISQHLDDSALQNHLHYT